MSKEPGAVQIRRAVRCRLPAHRLVFNKRGADQGQLYANIIEAENNEVWGVAYLCNPEALRAMDQREGVAGGHYQRVEKTVVADDGGQLDATTYVAGAGFVCLEGQPSDSYLARIIQGARQHGLPDDYVRYLENRARSRSMDDG